jgi:hypothetical protein
MSEKPSSFLPSARRRSSADLMLVMLDSIRLK